MTTRLSRSAYTAKRRTDRAANRRDELGLSHHPNGTGLHTCPRCEGFGVVDIYHWHPEMVGSRECILCDGNGFIRDGFRDPLLRLKFARQPYQRRTRPAEYAHLRQFCAIPCYQLRLIEAAVGCDLAAQGAVREWRMVG